MFEERIVNVPSAEIAVICGGYDVQPAFGEGDDGDGETGVAYIDECDVARVLWFWEIRFGDSIAESDGSGVINEAKAVEAGDGSGVEEGTALDIRVPTRDGDNDVCHTRFELPGSYVAELAEVHADELGGGEDLALAEIVDLRAMRGDRERIGGIGRTWTPTVPWASTRAALMNFFSVDATCGSSEVPPMRRFREPIVFLKFEVS